MESKDRQLIVDKTHDGVRLDKFIVDSISNISRSSIKRLIDNGSVLLNGETPKPHHKVHAGNEVRVFVPPPEESEIKAEGIPLDVIYEDGDLLVINKAAGMIVHPAGRIATGTLVNALLSHCKSLSGVGGVLKPGIVHRLDKGTSGCIVVAKSDEAHLGLSRQFENREVGKNYLGIVHGRVAEDHGVLEGLIARHPVKRKRMTVRQDAGRRAETRFEVLERSNNFTYVKLVLLTGRTHQIRVHMAHMGHPILGDDTYGRRGTKQIGELLVERPMLHAWRLAFRHPVTGKQMKMKAPVPEDMERVLAELRRISS